MTIQRAISNINRQLEEELRILLELEARYDELIYLRNTLCNTTTCFNHSITIQKWKIHCTKSHKKYLRDCLISCSL